MSQTPFKIVVGETTFPYAIADGQPMWRVTKSRGSNTFECTVEPDAPDYAGHVRVFGGEEIERAARMNAFWKDHFVTRGNFYASLAPGQIVHYNNAFAQFIRCRVVEKDGAMQLLPIALVGKWHEHDLPRWYDDGRYYDGGYHAQKIRDGSLETAWQPDSACVYESPDYSKSYKRDGDPTKLTPLSLDKPEPTPAQAEAARLLEAIEAISDVCQGRGHQIDWAAHHRERLLTIRTILDKTTLEA